MRTCHQCEGMWLEAQRLRKKVQENTASKPEQDQFFNLCVLVEACECKKLPT